MNKVLPGLYIGNYRDSKDTQQLERHKITHILAIHDAARRIYQDKEYLCIMASDSPSQNLSQYFPTCNDFIHEARSGGGNVLIHCLAGMSRSVTVAVAYVMCITKFGWSEGLKAVRGARPVSNPNSGFQKQLQDFEQNKLVEEKRRLLLKYADSSLDLAKDEEACKKLLVSYNNLLLSRAMCEGKCVSAKICPTGTCRPQSNPFRSIRQKSTEGGKSPTRTLSAGCKKSFDIDPCSASYSQQTWQRHYGCWRQHIRPAGMQTQSAPNSPILYRANPRNPQQNRSESLVSLPFTHEQATSSQDGTSIAYSSPAQTRSCPNSPRRTLRKQTSISSASRLCRTASTNAARREAALASNLSIVHASCVLGSTAEVSKSVKSREMVTYHRQDSGPSRSTAPIWGTNNTSNPAIYSFRKLAQGQSNIFNSSSPIGSTTRWVMKRSAYRYDDEA